MTTTQTLLPNGTQSGAGDFTVTGAALSPYGTCRRSLT